MLRKLYLHTPSIGTERYIYRQNCLVVQINPVSRFSHNIIEQVKFQLVHSERQESNGIVMCVTSPHFLLYKYLIRLLLSPLQWNSMSKLVLIQ